MLFWVFFLFTTPGCKSQNTHQVVFWVHTSMLTTNSSLLSAIQDYRLRVVVYWVHCFDCPGRWWSRWALGRLQVSYLSTSVLIVFCLSRKLPRFLLWKLFRKCEKVNAIADDLQLRKSVWEETEELIGRALDSPSALPWKYYLGAWGLTTDQRGELGACVDWSGEESKVGKDNW